MISFCTWKFYNAASWTSWGEKFFCWAKCQMIVSNTDITFTGSPILELLLHRGKINVSFGLVISQNWRYNECLHVYQKPYCTILIHVSPIIHSSSSNLSNPFWASKNLPFFSKTLWTALKVSGLPSEVPSCNTACIRGELFKHLGPSQIQISGASWASVTNHLLDSGI